MSSQHDFYTARATEARNDAEAAVLDNVRDRCIRAAEAWEAMAARAHRSDNFRAKQAAEKEAAAAEAPFLEAQASAPTPA
jgi:hypothetical protein